LTAWQGLFERAKLQVGERILIHGGSGAVGVFAIQLAQRAGAHVVTTASARNFDFLLQLGVNEMIDYRSVRFENSARDLDVVFDTVGGKTLKRS
jgi:NADPH:quinone reductase-like Zn-dependent oxidoreductase